MENKKSFPNYLFTVMVVVALAFMMVGCSDDSPPTGVNGPNGNGNGNGTGNGNDIGTAPTFDNVSQIFSESCISCHGAQGESGVRLNNYTNVIESVGDQYGVLVVQPGDADGSPLVDKIESSNPTFGARMPQGGPFLSDERISQIKAWIDNGAEDDQSDGGSSGGNGDNGGGY